MTNIRFFVNSYDEADPSLYVVSEGSNNFNSTPKKMKANNTDHEYNFTWNLFAHRKDILEFKLLVVKNYECVDIEYLMLDDEEFALFMLKFG